MTDYLRTRIAAVLQNHRQGRFAEWMTCSCDGHWSRFASAVYDGHVADAVIHELALRLQRDIDGDNEPRGLQPQHRYVTEWEVDE